MNRDETRSILTVVLVVILVVVLLPVLVMPLMMMGGGMMGAWNTNWGPNAWWGWLVMLLFWVLLIGGLVAVAAWVIRRSGQGGQGGQGTTQGGSSHDEALTILSQRYARGEIDRDQYEQIKRDLTGS